MPVKPTAPKHKTEILGDRLTISVPSPRPWVLSIFVGLGVVFFIISGVIILGGLVTNSDGFEGPIFLLVILIIFWTVAGGLMIYQFAWQISGKEVIEITTQSIIISRVVLSLRTPKEFSSEYIKDLRASTSNVDLNPYLVGYSGFYGWRYELGSLAFDYGSRTFRFGSGIEEAEARQIIAEIQQKYPQYKA